MFDSKVSEMSKEDREEALKDAQKGIGSDWKSEAKAMGVNPNPYEE